MGRWDGGMGTGHLGLENKFWVVLVVVGYSRFLNSFLKNFGVRFCKSVFGFLKFQTQLFRFLNFQTKFCHQNIFVIRFGLVRFVVLSRISFTPALYAIISYTLNNSND